MAATLETEWNERLVELENAKAAHQAARPTQQSLQSTLTQMNVVVMHLRDYWYQESVSNQEKKDLLRCVIERVLLEKQTNARVIRAEICWQGGAMTTVEVPKYLFSAPPLFHRITELARELPDAQIAEVLNAQGLETVKGRPWSARRVMDFRLSNGIPIWIYRQSYSATDREELPDYRRSCGSLRDQSDDRTEMVQTGPAVRETCRRTESLVD